MKPEHVEDGCCKYCGGMVGADGMSEGGEVSEDMHDEDSDLIQMPSEVGDESTQHFETVKMRDLASAIRGKRSH